MENISTYSVKLGKTNFIVSAKQSQTATKSLDKTFKNMCKQEVLQVNFVNNSINLD